MSKKMSKKDINDFCKGLSKTILATQGEEVHVCDAMEKAMESYNDACERWDDYSPMTGDHYSGTCMVLFKGTEDDCMTVKEFIISLNKDGTQGEEEVIGSPIPKCSCGHSESDGFTETHKAPLGQFVQDCEDLVKIGAIRCGKCKELYHVHIAMQETEDE